MGKISELSAAAALTGAEQVPIVQSAATVRTTVEAIGGGAWTDYTPQIDQGASTNIAKTIDYAKYVRIGKTIIVSVSLGVTGTGSGGSQVTVSVPVTAAFANLKCGEGTIFDSSANVVFGGIAQLVTTTKIRLWPTSDNGTGALGVATFTAGLASGDYIQFTVTYEAA